MHRHWQHDDFAPIGIGPTVTDEPRADSAAVDPTTDEVSSIGMQELIERLDRREREYSNLLALLERAQSECQQLREQLADAHSEDRRSALVSSTVDVPAGKLHVVGRMIRAKDTGGIITVVAEGRPVRMAVVPGWDFPGETGTAIAAEAILGREGWKTWKVTVLDSEAAANLPELDPKLSERETAPRKPKPEGADVPDLDDLDKDRAAAGDLRRHAHHVSAVSLHIVLVRHRRGKDNLLTDEQVGALKAEVRRAVEQDLGWQLVAANTGSTGVRNKHDHLHVAVSHVDVTEPIGAAIGRIKSLTSKRMRARFPELAAQERFWSAGYYVGAFGGPNKDAVIAYVDNQEQ